MNKLYFITKNHCIDLTYIFSRIVNQYVLISHRWLQKPICTSFTKGNGSAKSFCEAHPLFQGSFAFILPAGKKSKPGSKFYVNKYSRKKKKSVLGLAIAFGGAEESYH